MGVDWLNYHHLLYFWTVAREGGVAAPEGERAGARQGHLQRPDDGGEVREEVPVPQVQDLVPEARRPGDEGRRRRLVQGPAGGREAPRGGWSGGGRPV